MLNSIVQKSSLLKHPFYTLWLDGKLPKVAIQKYCGQYFQLVSHLPRWISQLHANCENERTRQILIHNLMEEELGDGNGGVAHTQLWLDFAEEMGCDRQEAQNAELLPETKEAIATISNAVNTSTSQGASALYAYESQVPEISEDKLKALSTHYNVISQRALRFFIVHSWADKKHRAVWEKMVEKHGEQEQAAAVADQTAKALWKMFDGMHREYVPESLKMSC